MMVNKMIHTYIFPSLLVVPPKSIIFIEKTTSDLNCGHSLEPNIKPNSSNTHIKHTTEMIFLPGKHKLEL